MKNNVLSGSYRLFLFSFTLVLLGCGGSSNNSETDVLASFIDDKSNPYQMLFVSDTKAYILRYGSPSIWIVDPSVSLADEENFKTGEISLKAYDSDGIPQMSAGMIHNNKLYVVMQALDENYVPVDAYMAVIDTLTDSEINVDSNPQKGFALSVKNPVDIDLHGDYVYVTGVGRYGSSISETEYTGGIERININDFSSTLWVDDGDASSHPYGQISSLTIVSDNLAYFTGYGSWMNSSLYSFDLATGLVNDTAVAGYAGVDIRSVALSPEDYLWVGKGDFSNPVIDILDPSDNTLIDSISLDKNPSQILFNADTAVIVGIASDFGSSDISLAETVAPYSIDKGYAAQDLSDIVAAVDANSFYRLGRSNQHNITKYDLTSPQVVEWQFSTNAK